jgi:hypothetical protein
MLALTGVIAATTQAGSSVASSTTSATKSSTTSAAVVADVVLVVHVEQLQLDHELDHELEQLEHEQLVGLVRDAVVAVDHVEPRKLTGTPGRQAWNRSRPGERP